MKKLLLTAAVGVVAAACANPNAPGYSSSAGSLAMSRDEKYLYAVDSDNGVLAVVDRASQQKIAQVPVGASPERIHVASDDTIYVSNRGARSVSVIQRDTWQETARIPVGVEPVGLTTSGDGKTLYVVNSTALDTPDHGSLMAIDTVSHQVKWEMPLDQEPRGIQLVDDHTAAVTFMKGQPVNGGAATMGGVSFLNLDKPTDPGSVQPVSDQIYASLNKSKLNPTSHSGSGYAPYPTTSAYSSFQVRAAADVVLSPNGQRLYVPSVLSREDPIAIPPSTFHAYYEAGGPCNLGSVASAGLVTIDASSKTPKVDDLTACSYSSANGSADFPPTTIGVPAGQTSVVQGATVGAVDPTNSFVFVVNRESNNVAIVSTATRTGGKATFDTNGSSVQALVSVGRAPNGISLTSDGKTAYIYNSFDHSISVLGQDSSKNITVLNTIQVERNLVAEYDLAVSQGADLSTKFSPQELAQIPGLKGRAMFFDATDIRLNSRTVGISCNTCHVEGGREDGHVWGFPDGPRNTPSLAGRMMAQTAPYHWTGEFADLNAFLDHTVQARMGGSGLDQAGHDQINAYIASLTLPDNPMHLSTPSAAQARGAQVFMRAQCNSCHAGAALTNNQFADVGTLVAQHDTASTVGTGFNVPSLLGVGRTAPFLHDGSAATLQDRITRSMNGTLHGDLRNVTTQDVSDLVAYLESL